MGIKSFFGKIKNGIKAGFNWVKDKAVPFVRDKVIPVASRIIKPVLGFASMLPGKLGTFGKIGQTIADTVSNVAGQIPNKDLRDKVQQGVSNLNDKVQSGISKGQDMATKVNDGINKGIGVATNMYNAAKQGAGAVSAVVKPIIKDM